MVLSPAARIEIVPDGKKMGNVYSISELAYPVVGHYWLDVILQFYLAKYDKVGL